MANNFTERTTVRLRYFYIYIALKAILKSTSKSNNSDVDSKETYNF